MNQISRTFSENCKSDKRLNSAYKAASGKNASYQDAAECADRVGNALAKAFKSNLSSAVLEGGRLSYDEAMQILEPMLSRTYQMNALACEKVQETLNKSAGINLKAQVPELNKDRIDGFARRIGSEENYDDVAWILDEPVKTYSRSVVDDSIKANADFHYKAGLSPKIVRTAEPKCCEWCASLAGEYDYPLMYDDQEVYRRHDNCRCVVEYKPGDGRKQNVHSRAWNVDSEELQRRIDFSNAPTEMNRRKVGPRGNEIIDKPTYQKVTRDFRKRGGEIVRGSEAAEHLGQESAAYVAGANRAYIRDDATVSDVLEEMFHAQQDRRGDYINLPADEMLLRREIDAQNYLLELTNRYKIPIEEVETTRQNLDYYQKLLEEILKSRYQ